MSTPFLGEIILVSFNFAPSGYFFCEGQLLPIASTHALFSLIGPTFGGDGIANFALPDLRGRAPMSRARPGDEQLRPGRAGGRRECVALTRADSQPHTFSLCRERGGELGESDGIVLGSVIEPGRDLLDPRAERHDGPDCGGPDRGQPET